MIKNKRNDVNIEKQHLDNHWGALAINGQVQDAEDSSMYAPALKVKRNGLYRCFLMCVCVCVFFVLYGVSLLHVTPPSPSPAHRTLHIATCRAYAKHDEPPDIWTTSAQAVKATETLSLTVVNVCKGRMYRDHHMTKFYAMAEYLEKIAHSAPQDLVIFTDGSDVLINGRALTTVDFERRFDRARGSAPILFMAEPFCWIGWRCSQRDIAYLYPEVSGNHPQPNHCDNFLNSGGIAGTVQSMREFYSVAFGVFKNVTLQGVDANMAKVVQGNDDQGLSTYVRKFYPSMIALDHRGLLFSTACSKYTCPTPRSCNSAAQSFFRVDVDGVIQRNPSDSRIASFMRECDKDVRPLVIHGNGRCKPSFFALVKERHVTWSRPQANLYRRKDSIEPGCFTHLFPRASSKALTSSSY